MLALTDEEKEVLWRVLERSLSAVAPPPLTIRERRTIKRIQGYVETTKGTTEGTTEAGSPD
jgi:hypothetical protein